MLEEVIRGKYLDWDQTESVDKFDDICEIPSLQFCIILFSTP